MKQLVFALQFKGNARPVPGAEGKLRAKTRASNQVLRTALTGKDVEAKVEWARAGPGVFESEVQIAGEGTFTESGTITYGKVGKVNFKTVGHGILGPSGIEGVQRGAVI